MTKIEIVQADITTLEVDAIVNAANERMLGGGGVDGAIHRAAGDELLTACREIPEVSPDVRCPTGESRVTSGYRLPARYVIHTVGPVWRGGNNGEQELLTSCYRSSMQLAVGLGCRSIAYPAISCGVYSYPLDLAAKVAIGTTSAMLQQGSPIEKVFLVAFGDEIFRHLTDAIDSQPRD